jgi:hypothetical protein
MLHVPGLYIASSEGRGRGVYTAKALQIGDLIEICPLIFIPKDQIELIDQTVLFQYYFLWPEDNHYACIALGYGSLYNHSNRPNAKVVFDFQNEQIEIESLEDIEPGEEIFIDYTGGEKRSQLWFDPV